MNKAIACAIGVGLMGLVATGAQAILCANPPGSSTDQRNLESLGSSTTIDGAIFFAPTNSTSSTGTGTLDSFVRINPGGSVDCEAGYNTSDRPTQLDENTSLSFTHDLLLSAVPLVDIGGTLYREFVLDINQTGSNPVLSLNQLYLYSGANQATNTSAGDFDTTTGNLGALSPIYTMATGSPRSPYITLNFLNENGSGGGIDMIMMVPDSLFGAGPYVYLYSEFGFNNVANDGFEEWAVRVGGVTGCPPGDAICTPQQIPEPNVVALLALGLFGVWWSARRIRAS